MKPKLDTQRIIVGVMGPGGSATDEECTFAYKVGRHIALRGLTLLSGGMNGTMEAACRGANEAGGLVVGICPTDDACDMNPYVHIPIVTKMGEGRNFINILSSHLVIAIAGAEHSGGTLSEIAFTVKDHCLPLCVTHHTPELRAYLERLEVSHNPIRFASEFSDVADFLDTSLEAYQ